MVKNIGDLFLNRVGTSGKYQYIIMTNLFFISFISDSYYIIGTLMQTSPIVDYNHNGTIITKSLTTEICESKEGFKIREDLSKQTWVLDYGIYCSPLWISFLGSSLCFGSVLGSISANFINSIGHKKSCFIYCCIIVFGSLILFIKNSFILLFSNLCFGLSNVGMIILKNTIITEMTNSNNRSYFMFLSFCTSILCNVIYFTLFNLRIKWQWMYGMASLALVIFVIPFAFFYVENPRYYLMKNDEKNVIKSMLKIAKINGKDENEESILKFYKESMIPLTEDYSTDVDFKNPNKKLKKSTNYKKLIIFTIMFYIYVTHSICATFELKFYSNDTSSLFYNFLMIITMFAYVFASFLMNTNIMGRKLTIIFLLIIVIGSRTFKLFFSVADTLLYFIARISLFSIQVPLHTIVTESFSTEERLTKYGFIYLFAKIGSIFCPFILEYLSVYVFDFLMIIFAIIQIVLTAIINETYRKSLSD